MDHCLNCKRQVDSSQKYCPECGQKLTFSHVTVWTLLGEFFSNLLNFDNSIFRSIRMLFVPGFLPKEYMEGRRKRYLNPVRFFFITLVLLLSVISFFTDFTQLDFFVEENAKKIGVSEFKHDYLLWKDSLPISPSESAVLDSLESQVLSEYKDVDQDSVEHNLDLFGVNMREHKFLRKDLYQENIDTLLQRYEVVKFWDRVVISQFVRTMRDPAGAVQFFIGNMLWGVLSTIFILGVFMKLLYVRRSRYYVEHAVVLFTLHTFTFLVVAISSLVMDSVTKGPQSVVASSATGVVLLYSFLTIKKYYGQGYLKTVVKFGIMILLYFLILLMMMGVVFAASLLLYK